MVTGLLIFIATALVVIVVELSEIRKEWQRYNAAGKPAPEEPSLAALSINREPQKLQRRPN